MKKIIERIKATCTEVAHRIKTESPVFFKKLKAFAFKVTLSSAVILIAIHTIPLDLPAYVSTVLSYIIAAGVGVFGTSILTKIDAVKSDAPQQ
jgi:hypothetical protein